MPRSYTRFWLAALVTAWAVDFLFYGKPIGVSYLVWTVVAVLAGFWLARSEGVRPAWPSYLMAGLALILAATAFVRREPFTVGLGVVLSLGCLLLLAATFRTGHWLWFRVWDHIAALAVLVFAAITRPFGLKSVPAEEGEGGAAPVTRRKAALRKGGSILTGILLALPVVAVLAALLSSADPIFAERVQAVLDALRLEKLPEYLFRLIYILVLGFLLCGVLLHALLPRREATRPDPQQRLFKPFLGWTETAIVLGSVVALFVFFVVVQFQYLFGGEANITAAGYTYSEYARRGFGELVWVAVLSLLLYLTLDTVARRDTDGQRRGFNLLAALLVGLVLVILASALQRLVLYEQAYGFTRLRTYTLIFIPWLAGLLLAAMILALAGRSGRFGLALLVVALGFGLTFSAMNVDGFIARQNVQRALAGEELDSSYLTVLSSDAVPVLFDLYRRPDLPQAIRDGLGAELACRTVLLAGEEPRPWQAFTLSQRRASQILSTQTETWKQYRVERLGGIYQVKIDNGMVPCTLAGWMD